MAALTPITATSAFTTATPLSVSASDTVAIDTGLLTLLFQGGAGSDTITVTDAGLTPGGTAASAAAITVSLSSGATNFKVIKVPSAWQNSSGVVTITHSAPTGVVCFPLKYYI